VQTSTIPAFYGSLDSGPDPGAVVGITLGAVAGFVLLLWLIYACLNLGNGGGPSESVTVVTEGTSSVVTRRSRRHRRERDTRARSRRRQREEMVEIRRVGSSRARGGPVIVEEVRVRPASPDVERVVVEERRRSVSRPAAAPRVRRVSSSEGATEDEVVVIEEHSPPRRQRSRVRSVERRSSGFR
jgi:hypothetical protein